MRKGINIVYILAFWILSALFFVAEGCSREDFSREYILNAEEYQENEEAYSESMEILQIKYQEEDSSGNSSDIILKHFNEAVETFREYVYDSPLITYYYEEGYSPLTPLSDPAAQKTKENLCILH